MIWYISRYGGHDISQYCNLSDVSPFSSPKDYNFTNMKTENIVCLLALSNKRLKPEKKMSTMVINPYFVSVSFSEFGFIHILIRTSKNQSWRWNMIFLYFLIFYIFGWGSDGGISADLRCELGLGDVSKKFLMINCGI